MKKRRLAERGDTMIEVLMAVTMFSVVAVAGLTIMNQGSAAAQRSLEVTLVRYEIDAQAEALRMLYDEAMTERGGADVSAAAESEWKALLSAYRKGAATGFDSMVEDGVRCINPAASGSGADGFVMNVQTLKATSLGSLSWDQTSPYARVFYGPNSSSDEIDRVNGIWIEAVQGNGGAGPGYTDFHIRACWSTVGQTSPVTLGTIVRLYEP